ncbi:MAG: LysE family translocator [Steroidobacteraceae bacterium]
MEIAFLSFILISAVIIVTPGPDTALTIRNVLLGGRSGGIFTALGVVAGQAIWALAASAGVVSILVASEKLFYAVKLAGALYLIYLGGKSLLSAIRGRVAIAAIDRAHPSERLSPSATFRQGFISNLANPKMAVFFASILPQFAPSNGQVFGTLIALGILFCSMTFLWLSLYAVAIAKIRDAFIAPRVQRLLEAVTGGALLVLGLRLTSSER